MWQHEDAMRCGGCGLSREETMDPANQFLYDVRVFVCHACAAKEAKATQMANPPKGLMYSVSK